MAFFKNNVREIPQSIMDRFALEIEIKTNEGILTTELQNELIANMEVDINKVFITKYLEEMRQRAFEEFGENIKKSIFNKCVEGYFSVLWMASTQSLASGDSVELCLGKVLDSLES